MTNLKVKLRVGAEEKHKNDLYSPNEQVITLSIPAYDIPLACKMVGLAQFVYSGATGVVPDSISSCFPEGVVLLLKQHSFIRKKERTRREGISTKT